MAALTDQMKQIVDRVKALGFDVYMRPSDRTYMLFVEGKNIGYLQINRLAGGIDINTVHVPNTTTGTGFQIERGMAERDLTADKLRAAFDVAPHWGSYRSSVRKYAGIDAYRRENAFNAAFERV